MFWISLFGAVAFFLPKLFKLLSRARPLRVIAEGNYDHIRHGIHLVYRVDRGSALADKKNTKKVICFSAIHLDSGEVCFVRNICEVPFEKGARIRIRGNGTGKYKIEEIKDPASP
ncbi:MAG: hypothetical protein Q7S36_02385 [Candidatus Liptonbacteria bacterium]|nr:hypothetical protein [Candidatus Liptonbacteria bacterium]